MSLHCPSCKLDLPSDKFNKTRRRKTGHQVYCKSCTKLRYGVDSRLRTWKSNLKRKFGLTPDDYAQMLADQDGGCAICGATEHTNPYQTVLHVDHNHETGQVRGLLCAACNTSLGLLKEDPERLQKMVDYIDFYSEEAKAA